MCTNRYRCIFLGRALRPSSTRNGKLDSFGFSPFFSRLFCFFLSHSFLVLCIQVVVAISLVIFRRSYYSCGTFSKYTSHIVLVTLAVMLANSLLIAIYFGEGR